MAQAASAVAVGAEPRDAPGLLRRLAAGRSLPIAVVLACVLVAWYAGAVLLNAPQARARLEAAGGPVGFTELVAATWAMDRPVLPAPHQVAADLWSSIVEQPVTSKRSLVYHAQVTMSAALAGFVIGAVLGIVLAAGIVHVVALDRSLMPWIIASQTVPIIAIAPMVVVVLGNLGLTGLVPKAIISAYLSFFPVTIGMVKGFRSPDPLQIDLMRTYSATRGQLFWKLRWPSSFAFLFPSLKVAISLALVGAIVAELPTGAQAGLGARLLTGSYYGLTVQIWSALIVASVLALLAVGAVELAERMVARATGGRP